MQCSEEIITAYLHTSFSQSTLDWIAISSIRKWWMILCEDIHILSVGMDGEHPKIVNSQPIFWEKSLKLGEFFCQPLKTKRGFEACKAHPCPNRIWVPPPTWLLQLQMPITWRLADTAKYNNFRQQHDDIHECKLLWKLTSRNSAQQSEHRSRWSNCIND